MLSRHLVHLARTRLPHQRPRLLLFSTSRLALKSKPNKALDLLSSQYVETKEEVLTDVVVVPAGVADLFFSRFETLSRSLAGDIVEQDTDTDASATVVGVRVGFELLLGLVPLTTTAEEAALLQQLIAMWTKADRFFTKAKSVLLIEALVRGGQSPLVFALLCDRGTLRPDSGHITGLVRYFSKAALAVPRPAEDLPEQEGDDYTSAHLVHLDLAYKSFGLYLHHDIAPTQEAYASLIAAGIYGGTREGMDRSRTTIAERRTLGWTGDVDSELDQLYLGLRDGHFRKVLEGCERLRVSGEVSGKRQALLFKLEALVGLGNLQEAGMCVKELRSLAETSDPVEVEEGKNPVTKSRGLGHEYWKTETELVNLVSKGE